MDCGSGEVKGDQLGARPEICEAEAEAMLPAY